MRRSILTIFSLFFCLTGITAAQAQRIIAASFAEESNPPEVSVSAPALTLPAAPVRVPRMAPELALETYQGRGVLQAAQLASYSATTLVRAQLPDTSQYGEYELERHYSAPHTLVFKGLRFTGDSFVKSNVILRLLQSEADHVQKDVPSLNAISRANYKFSYKGTSEIAGRVVHVYQVKPKQKRPGLFKGHIYIDAYTGSLVRSEGRLAKSPSLFIKKIEFVQDYADVDTFTFPVHIHSEAQTRLVGRAVVDIFEKDYQPVTSAIPAESAQTAGSVPAL